MSQENSVPRFPTVGDGSGLEQDDRFYREEVQLAFRNRGMPLEALRYPITPTGMHYLLTHFDVPEADAGTWRLTLGGLLDHPMSLSLEDIKARPPQTTAVTMECAGNGRALLKPRAPTQPWLLEAIGTSQWTGAPLKGLLAEAGVDPRAVEILFTGFDQGVQGDQVQYYQRSLALEEATRDEVLLAYEMNGRPLEPQHGFPLRLIVPGWYGMTSVKWLDRIEAVAEHFQGYQMDETYRYVQSADDQGDPVDLIKVRALMVPPGIPDFLTRIRLVKAGPITITGRAWAGRLGISRVEVSGDGALTWADADLGETLSPYAWRAWTCQWTATPGKHTLCVRATDQQGNMQPVEQPWNYQGMGNNMVQRVQVLVE
ncbi:MAG: sulfite oxidase [SAR202 cluster bacterium Io17-Chloro-G9]|nr:MAG: sulfite oxidase [SAR202 cluster bacterium Io17-Chloro-G9]